MPHWLETSDPAFLERFAAFLAEKRETAQDVEDTVRAIIADVRTRGDAAVIEYTRRFDRLELTRDQLRVPKAAIDAAVRKVGKETLAALELAAERIRTHHARQLPTDDRYRDDQGVELGHRWSAIEAAGLYVPGGLAAYPSSVLMNAMPAVVAGVPRLAMCVPAPEGEINPLVLAAARIADIREVYRIGGAQAIAALAHGTETIAAVAKITGPGNAYVSAAKRQVFGTVGIDLIAGPSEVLVIADADNDPEWIAADLIAQAEHDAAAQAILMTDDRAFAQSVAAAVPRRIAQLPRANLAAQSWRDFGAIILLRSLDEAPQLADRIAAEHLEIATADPEAIGARIRNAGALFLGAHTPEVIGDYVAGSNHVLPTARSARFSSGLGVLDFMKRTSILKLDRGALGRLAPAAMTLAAAEGLDGHRESVAVRLRSPAAAAGSRERAARAGKPSRTPATAAVRTRRKGRKP